MKNIMHNHQVIGDSLFISISPDVYSLDIIYSAAYVLLDKAYINLDGNPKERIIIEIKPKSGYSIEELAEMFNSELINYAVYKIQSEKNQVLRNTMLQRALITNSLEGENSASQSNIDDPEGIAIPWEQKYGNDCDSASSQNKKDNPSGKKSSDSEIVQPWEEKYGREE